MHHNRPAIPLPHPALSLSFGLSLRLYFPLRFPADVTGLSVFERYRSFFSLVGRPRRVMVGQNLFSIPLPLLFLAVLLSHLLLQLLLFSFPGAGEGVVLEVRCGLAGGRSVGAGGLGVGVSGTAPVMRPYLIALLLITRQ